MLLEPEASDGAVGVVCKRGSDGSLDCDFLRWRKARRVWYGNMGDWRLKM